MAADPCYGSRRPAVQFICDAKNRAAACPAADRFGHSKQRGIEFMKMTMLLAVLAVSPAFTQPFAWEPEPQASTPQIYHVQLGSGSFLGVAVQEVDSERAKVLK